MKKVIWTYGAIASSIVVAMMIAAVIIHENHPDSQGSMAIGFLGMFIAFAFNFVALARYRRDHVIEGLSFGKAISICLLISLITTTAYVGAWGVSYHFFFPDFMDQYLAMEVTKLQEAGHTAQQIAAETADTKWMADHYDNPLVFIGLTAIEILPIGLGMSLLAALIMKRKPAHGASQLSHT
ncbi:MULTISPECIES: DUF4199 domain-containing protein [unclassified Flavobacterium]|uniref:DUF4199 domain-containing protein n=1 Tax=unclassified Flavobacterium TaxID=196869 RepID=UPI001F146FAE|nr:MULTISPECIES: DUF4199 domain-containing protein [unclassified Flavobacterium]UMY64436.1 DUF4199 domain-containing protein [Flavobacterium sp. HJ-32-4]